MNNYFNTTSLEGTELQQAQRSAKSQDLLIYQYFILHPFSQFSRSDLEERKILGNAPTASYGRSLNTLMNQGKLKRLSDMKVGNFGAKQHLYALKVEFKQMEIFKNDGAY